MLCFSDPAGAVYEVPNATPILNNPHNNSYVHQQPMIVINSNTPPQYHQQQVGLVIFCIKF